MQADSLKRKERAATSSDHALTLDDLIARDPKLEMDAELAKHFASEILVRFQERGWETFTSTKDVLRRRWGELYIRRESPQRIMQAVSQQKDIHLKFDGPFGEKYLNAAVWSPMRPDSLRWVFMEGWSQSGGLAMVEAFDKNTSEIQEHVLDIPKEEMGRVLKGGLEVMDRTTFRSLSGAIRPPDIKFVLLRVPGLRFPQEHMTDDEREQLDEYVENLRHLQDAGSKGERPQPFFIFRAFVPGQTEDHVSKQVAA